MASGHCELPKKDRGIWLVGGTVEKITGSKLPSNQQVLQRFFHLHNTESQTISASATATMKEVVQFWYKARIPIRKDCHIIAKIKDLHSAWVGIKKNASRKTDTQKEKERQFTESLPDLFDIAHAEALAMIQLPEDRKFLEAQREKGRRGCMGSVDMVLDRKEQRCKKRRLEEEMRTAKEAKRMQQVTMNVTNDSDTEISSSDRCDTDDYSNPLDVHTKLKRVRPTNFVTPVLAAALDRSKVSDRNAAYIITAAAESLGHSPADLAINKESIRRSRRKHREAAAREILASFDPNCPLTVHWDGKMLPALTSKELVDRLAVLVSGDGTMKLLGVPKLPNETGEAEATAVFNLIQEWNIANRIKFMCFDTTASNTGLQAGACVLLEKKLGRDLISLACRHHIMELIVAKVFDSLMGPSSGPNIKLFQRFRDCWCSIDKSTYESGMGVDFIASALNPVRDELINFIQKQLAIFHPRDDYRELLQLSLLFLGANCSPDVNVLAPGAFHRARWMAKLIYSLKVFLFRGQFKTTARELSSLGHFNNFVLKVYLYSWFTCQCATSAPQHDLQLLQRLESYKETNEAVAKAAIKSFSGHLWYLSEILVGLALFDNDVSAEMKSAMVAALDKITTSHPPRRIAFTPTLYQSQLSDFVSHQTRQLFTALDIPQDFLTKSPDQWNSDHDYIAAQQKLRSLKVVNDAAERGVALIQTFNGVLTNQEEQKQFLLQVVEKHRCDFPNANKSTLTATASASAVTSSILHC